MQGFIGSLAYALPVTIPWALLAFYFGRLSSASGLVIVLLASFGYQKFKGKSGSWSKWILVLSSLTVIFLANVVSMFFILWKSDVPPGQMLDLFKTNAELQGMFKLNLFISLVLGTVGWLWIAFDFYTKKNYIKDAEKL